ncbi:hypothetical protein YC2023_091687 [Brassica napus]
MLESESLYRRYAQRLVRSKTKQKSVGYYDRINRIIKGITPILQKQQNSYFQLENVTVIPVHSRLMDHPRLFIRPVGSISFQRSVRKFSSKLLLTDHAITTRHFSYRELLPDRSPILPLLQLKHA